MDLSAHLHVSMPHVEKLADFLVLLRIFCLTSLGIIQGGLALSAVLEMKIRRCDGATDDAAAHGHDCSWRVVKAEKAEKAVKSVKVVNAVKFGSEGREGREGREGSEGREGREGSKVSEGSECSEVRQ
jgi:hypothetical protein